MGAPSTVILTGTVVFMLLWTIANAFISSLLKKNSNKNIKITARQ